MHKRFAIAAFAASLVSPSFAADDPAAVVVTATRSEVPIEKALADVSVVTAAQIARSGHQSVVDVLASLPGVEVAANGGPGQPATIFLRGTNGTQTVVLIDGVRQTNLNFGTSSLQSIPLAVVDRIEVLRGGGSSLYGAGALGGVIQIFTKRGDKQGGTSAEVGYGDYGRSKMIGSIGGATESGLAYRVTVGEEEVRRPSASMAGLPGSINFNFDPDNDRAKNNSLAVRLTQTLRPGHSVDFSHLSTRNSARFDYVLPPAMSQATNTQRLTHTSLSSNNQVTPYWTSTLLFGATRDQVDTTGSGAVALGGTDDRIISRGRLFSWQNDFDTHLGRLRVGLESETQRLSSEASLYAQTSRTSNALLLGYAVESDSQIARVNLRSDSITGYARELSWDAAYGYRFTPNWMSSARIKRAFRAPSFNDMYFTFNSVFFNFLPNPNLKPEIGRTGEVDLTYSDARQRASLIAFESRITNLSSFVMLNATDGTITNIGASRIQGMTGNYSVNLGDWRLRGDYTLQRAKDLSNGNDLPRRARHYANLGVERSFGNWVLGAEASDHGARYDGAANTLASRMAPYSLLNLHGKYRISQELEAYFRLNNMLDEKYELAQNFTTLGRNLFVGLRYTLQ